MVRILFAVVFALFLFIILASQNEKEAERFIEVETKNTTTTGDLTALIEAGRKAIAENNKRAEALQVTTTTSTSTTVAPVKVVKKHVHRTPTTQAAKASSRTKTTSAPAPSSGGVNSHLDSIKACESGGNYGAVSRSGKYRGAYQFSRETWAGVGGSGDPAAASSAEQDKRAQMLYDRSGAGQWPVCQRR
jgi:hypothetical protein